MSEPGDDYQTIAEMRQRTKATQKEMATNMMIPLRTYEDVEAGRSVFRSLHETAAYMAMLRIGVAKQDASCFSTGLRNLIVEAAALIEADKKPAG